MKVGDLIRSKVFDDTIGIVMSEPHKISLGPKKEASILKWDYVDIMWSVGEYDKTRVDHLEKVNEGR